MPSTLLKEPAYKMLLHQMKTAESIMKQTYNASYMKWQVCIERSSLTVSNIWIQGQVIDVNKPPTGKDFEMHISDESGVALVTGLGKLPKFVDIKRGDHVMVVGYVMSAGILDNYTIGNNTLTLCAKLKAIKVSKLCSTDLWYNEVKDAQKYIISSYINS